MDEAHHIAPNQYGYQGMLERYAIELRKYGMGLVVMATRPTQVSENIIANCNTLICHMLNDQPDVEIAAGFFIGSNVGDALRRLPVGEAMLQVNHPLPGDAVRIGVGTAEQRAMLGLSPEIAQEPARLAFLP